MGRATKLSRKYLKKSKTVLDIQDGISHILQETSNACDFDIPSLNAAVLKHESVRVTAEAYTVCGHQNDRWRPKNNTWKFNFQKVCNIAAQIHLKNSISNTQNTVVNAMKLFHGHT